MLTLQFRHHTAIFGFIIPFRPFFTCIKTDFLVIFRTLFLTYQKINLIMKKTAGTCMKKGEMPDEKRSF
jgi:hypothetical protein